MRRLASAILLIGAIGCNSPADDCSKSLQDGQAAMRSMAQAAVERNYDLYFQQFGALRQCYVDVATMVRKGDAQADRKEILATLEQWETAISTARAAWADLNAPHNETLSEMTQRRIQPEILQHLEKLNQESRQARERINDEWAPLESRLDDEIAAIQALRSE